mgnify:CR=1 FL=1
MCRFFLCTIEVKWGNAQWIIKRPYGQFQAFDAWTNHYVLHLLLLALSKQWALTPVQLATCR